MRFIIQNNQRLSDAIGFISRLPQDRPWQLDIKEYTPNRSNSQNNLYWMWIEVISAYTGDSKDDLHEKFAVKFLGIEEKTIAYRNRDGNIAHETIRRPRSTTKLTTKEFTDYLNNIEITVTTALPDFRLPYPDDRDLAMGIQK